MARDAILYHPFEQRNFKVELFREFIDGWIGLQLLVISNEYQMVSFAAQRRNDMRF